MLTPIKFNSSSFLCKLFPFWPSITSPINLVKQKLHNDWKLFNASVSSLKFKTTFKTTLNDRHKLTNELINNHIENPIIVLDVGASTGVTSFDFIKAFESKVQHFFVTDNNVEISYVELGDFVLFFDDNTCILVTSKHFVIYPQESNLVKLCFRKSIKNALKQQKNNIKLIDPRLLTYIDNKKVTFLKYSFFDKWEFTKVNLIKVANVLNRVYFSDSDILVGIQNLIDAFNSEGLLFITENRELEKTSMFRFENSKLTLVKSLNGGSEIEGLIVSNFS